MYRLLNWKPCLEHLKLHSAIYDARNVAFGKGNHPIFMSVLLGSIEGKPYDLTSLAFKLGMSRPTLTRKVEKAAADGWVEIQPSGLSHVVLPTQKLADKIVEEFDQRWCGPDGIYSRLARIHEMQAADPIPSKARNDNAARTALRRVGQTIGLLAASLIGLHIVGTGWHFPEPHHSVLAACEWVGAEWESICHRSIG